MTSEQTEHDLPTDTQIGLTSDAAAVLLARVGPNELPRPPRRPWWRLLISQVTHFFAVLLWVAAALALLAGMPTLAVAIVVIVVLNGLFAYAQEHRADQAAQKLGTLMPVKTRVVRDGRLQEVPAPEVVPGDVVLLEAGDRVPADGTLILSEEVTADESMLTGESVPVRKPAGAVLRAATFLVQGSGRVLVTATGAQTEVASVAGLISNAHRPPSPLSLELDRLVRIIAVVALTVGVVLGVVSLLLGGTTTDALLFAVGVSVALVPEGLLPTVTLSLARGAQRMAESNALVRHLEAVETLGSTTFICTDKTGTLTRNEMTVMEIWTPPGRVVPRGDGYEPTGTVSGDPAAVRTAAEAAVAARACVTGRAVLEDGVWQPSGDPMEVALDVLAARFDTDVTDPTIRVPFVTERRFSAAVVGEQSYFLGAPERILPACAGPGTEATSILDAYADQGRRVVAVARVGAHLPQPTTAEELAALLDEPMELLALLAIEDPPREGVREALESCRTAGIRVAMMTGDNARTAAAIATEVGLLRPGGVVVEGERLPADDAALANLLDDPRGAVVARVTPADKLRIANALRLHGHVVAMTGDGVNDAAALRGADVGVAMGLGGSDVARDAADLVLLDDHFATIVKAIELGRATYANIRRFLTFHLTDNVAELAPFAVWALSGGSVPAALSVLQILALDIGTDMLPALALGSEPPSRRTMEGPRARERVASGSVLRRAFLVLGPIEAVAAVTAFVWVLTGGGWELGETPGAALLARASGTAFAVIAVAQVANAFACRSESRPAWRVDPRRNPLVLIAVAVELVLLAAFLGLPWLADLLGGSWPSGAGWLWALGAGIALLLGDRLHKARRAARHRSRAT
ncbi:cation-translocating P-type ATPase [Nocardioides sp. YIM B13467]|uniref:cation-translocating P-type ATPase n=1 Tax=Nocardioides sp. YIM B13467 TaxID=3366294 RepID=UPI00366D03EB